MYKHNLNTMAICKSIIKKFNRFVELLNKTKDKKLIGVSCILTGVFFSIISLNILYEETMVPQIVCGALLFGGIYLAELDMSKVNCILNKFAKEYLLFALTLYCVYKLYEKLFFPVSTAEWLILPFYGIEATFYALRTLRFIVRVVDKASRCIHTAVSTAYKKLIAFLAEKFIPGTETATDATEKVHKLIKSIFSTAGTLALAYPVLKKVLAFFFGI